MFQAGDRIGKYRHFVGEWRGGGGNAAIYSAIDGRDGNRRVLKVFDVRRAQAGKKDQERFANEGEAIAMVDHVNIVRYFDSGIDDGQMWLLLEECVASRFARR